MKNKLRSLSAILLTGLFLAQLTAPALALDARKDETVYVNLNFDGSVRDTIVVNTFQVPQNGKIYDYGTYSDIQNLSGTGTPTVEDGLIQWNAQPGTTFYYRGTMENAQLPWNFRIRYYLDGKPVEAPALIGAEGRMEIVIEAEANGAADDYFGTNYAAQISVPLKEEYCKNVISDAEIVTAGGLKTCAFTVMPGATETCSVAADINGFEMDGISIQMVRLSGSMLDSLDLLKTAISQISGGIGALADGTGQLKDGTADLAAGLSLVGAGTEDLAESGAVISSQLGDLESGAGDLRDGLSQLSEASGQIREGLQQLDENAYEFEKGYGQIEAGLKQMTDNRKAVEDGVKELKENGPDLQSGMNQLASGAQDLGGGIRDLSDTYDDQMELVNGLLAYVQAQYAADPASMPAELQQLVYGISQYSAGVSTGFDSLESGASGLASGIRSAGAGVDDLYDGALEFGNGSLDLMDGVSQLHDGISELNAGFEKYEKGIGDTADGYLTFDDSLSQVQLGADGLAGGIGEMNTGLLSFFSSLTELSDSINQLASGAQQLPDGIGQLQAGQEQMLAGLSSTGGFGSLSGIDAAAAPVSFAAPGLVTPESVQFVVKTPELQAEEEEAPETAQEVQTFWDKLWGLFSAFFS